ncbi:threonine ammonia-lyase [Kineococcus xinjiangensis]|uniref:threonine ammonia-lyase n=1 Tax=Kineococcus xinjiangensis TaxID=512762 RepID=UPI000CEB995E
MPRVRREDVLAARELVDSVVRRTQLLHSRALSERVGGPVHLKCENLQRAGSFKIRGAYVRIARLSEAERALGVVAASAGNHAQGVALAARLLGIRATVFMPEGAPIPKVQATRGYGAEVRFHGRNIDDALVEARRFGEETGAVLIHPFDHPDIVAGQGSVGLEVLEQCPDVRTVLVCTGGGGLVAGVAAALEGRRNAEGRPIRVVGVQAEQAAAYPESLRAGRPVALPRMSTMADGIAVGRPGDVPFAVIRDLVDDVVTVSEEGLSRALVLLLERSKLVVEPAGAAAVAALLDGVVEVETPAVAVLSGGNIDPLLLHRVLQHGLAAAGRYVTLQVTIPDKPGGLVRLLQDVAAADANVVDVGHARTDPGLEIGQVQVRLEVETRGPEHRDHIVERLRAAGFGITAMAEPEPAARH